MRARARAITLVIAALLATPAAPAVAQPEAVHPAPATSDAAVAIRGRASVPTLTARLQSLLPGVAAAEARALTAQTAALAHARFVARRQAAARASRARALAAIRHLAMPAFGRISEGFGARGLWSSRHTGIDIDAPYWATVHSVVAGVVVKSVYDRAYGNLVIVRGHGVDIWYAHMARRDVRVGQRVRFDQALGHVGCTGRCFGPHLHLEVRVHDLPTDPAAFLWGPHRGIPGPVPSWARHGVLTTLSGA